MNSPFSEEVQKEMEEVRNCLLKSEKGGVVNNLQNSQFVLENDPTLKCAIQKNLLSGQIEIVKPMIWRRNGLMLTDTDVPGILALPGLLVAPKVGIIGMIAAPLLGCSVHLENEDGKTVDVGNAVKDAAETVVDTATTAAKTVKEEIEKAWDAISADDPEGCPLGEENEDEPTDQEKKEDDIPTIKVNPDDPTKPE